MDKYALIRHIEALKDILKYYEKDFPDCSEAIADVKNYIRAAIEALEKERYRKLVWD